MVAVCVLRLHRLGARQFLLYPVDPYGTGYFHGLLGYSQRAAVDADVAKVVAQRKTLMDKIAALSFAEINADPAAAGSRADRRPDHVRGKLSALPWRRAAAAGPGYPALAAGAWIWGGTLDDIQQTITHGIRSGDPDARAKRDAPFRRRRHAEAARRSSRSPITSGPHSTATRRRARTSPPAPRCSPTTALSAMATRSGQPRGRRAAAGQPRPPVRRHAATRSWLRSTLPRQGVMPNWGTRLDPATIKAVTLYVHSLGGGE